MPTGSSDSPPQYPSNSGDYGVESFTSADEAERLVDLGNETESILVLAPPGNGGIIYLGFDDEVDSNNGIPLDAGSGVSFDIDTDQLGLFAAADTIGDEARWIYTS